MFRLELTPELLTAIFGALLALAFDYMPGLAPWYDALSNLKKRQVMALVMFVTVAIIFASSCYGIVAAGIDCTKESAATLIQMVLTIVTVNYSIHGLTKPTNAYKEIWMRR